MNASASAETGICDLCLNQLTEKSMYLATVVFIMYLVHSKSTVALFTTDT